MKVKIIASFAWGQGSLLVALAQQNSPKGIRLSGSVRFSPGGVYQWKTAEHCLFSNERSGKTDVSSPAPRNGPGLVPAMEAVFPSGEFFFYVKWLRPRCRLAVGVADQRAGGDEQETG